MHWQALLALSAALMVAAHGVRAADLVVWWQRWVTAEEHDALAEVVAAFERDTGKQVALVPFSDRAASKLNASVEAGRPPDFAFGISLGTYLPKWALEDRLADLSEPVGHFADLFDPDALDRGMLLNATTN